MKNEIVFAGKGHTINLDKELTLLFKFFGIDPAKDKLALNIFLDLVTNSCSRGKGLKTMDVVNKEHVTQAAVVYHLNNFMKKGFVVKNGRFYCLRGDSLKETIEEIEIDKLREMDRIKKVAKRIDDFL